MRNRLSTSKDGSSTVTYSGNRIDKNGTMGEFTSGATPSKTTNIRMQVSLGNPKPSKQYHYLSTGRRLFSCSNSCRWRLCPCGSLTRRRKIRTATRRSVHRYFWPRWDWRSCTGRCQALVCKRWCASVPKWTRDPLAFQNPYPSPIDPYLIRKQSIRS